MIETPNRISFAVAEVQLPGLLGDCVRAPQFRVASPRLPLALWREWATKSEFTNGHVCSLAPDFREIGKVLKREQSCTNMRKQGTNKK